MTEATDKSVRIPIVEERLRVEKQTVETGRVRVASHVVTHTQPIRGTLRAETVRVEHVPVGHLFDEVPPIRTEDDRTIVPVVEEVLVKRIRVIEEIHLIRERSETASTKR
ncbi:DUF2382 domain-containing protein [Sphingomonas xinjiangensis]|uniref:DUF2382 domain-containing protein n=1 Tax=Sphingomonas xinjiangensis TaxID=643568 RepID=A0A840YR15_9SPHN|nr:hypothetical protein [Sphingomonas xinjiangensis]